MKITLLGILVLMLSVGCSKTKDLADAGATTKEMNTKLDTTNQSTEELGETTDELLIETQGLGDRTEQLLETTGEMNDTTAKLQEMTGELRGLTSNMYVQLRLKEAEETRDRRTKNLLAAESFHQKVTEAAAYLKAFEYHYWTGNEAAGDDQHVREEKMMAATQEFFRFATELVTMIGEAKIFNVSDNMQDKTAKSLNALSVALHQIDDYQKILIDREGIKKVHMLSMIKDSLMKLGALERGEITLSDLKDYEKEVLENIDLAKALLKIRLNTFGIMALTKVSDIANKNAVQKFAMVARGWDSKFHSLNPALQHKVIRYLREANKTKAFLVAAGANPATLIDNSLKAVLNAMDAKDADRCSDCNQEKANHQDEFKSLVDGFIN